ncbi:MAG TPA: APC family permease [Gemmatimonadales bacterium]|nr:APC family permease [Gemmatimonadales bacterium]
MAAWLKRAVLGRPRDVLDPSVFHKVSLVAFLAWVGLGADGLSSSAYGPEEAFKALGTHTYLAVALAVATALTVFVISYAYSRIIEHFPFGGGGYVVASRLLGSSAGVASGSALLVDYVLTISISIAAGVDAVFSFLRPEWQAWKLPVSFVVMVLLSVMNLRGVKESVTVLAPIFLTFVVTHAILIMGVVVSRRHEVPQLLHAVGRDFTGAAQASPVGLGLAGVVALFLRAYSLGGGTYTGIEAVSNGLSIMREPKVETGKRTMMLMAVSLAVTAAGIIVGYLLVHAAPEQGKTMNAVLAERFTDGVVQGWPALGHGFVLVTLLAEALLLFVAAQAGFIDGPRVMANMATDSWLPHRFAQLSDRLTMQNGVLLMGGAAVVALWYTGGVVDRLVVMYSINVFITFSLTEVSMCRYWIRDRKKHPNWRKEMSVHAAGLALCLTILFVTVYEKFGEGGWITLLVTCALIGVCFLIRGHYRGVQGDLQRLDAILPAIAPTPAAPAGPAPLDPQAPTAVVLVGDHAGLGVHALLTIRRLFPNVFGNFVFASIGVIDSATFKNVEEVEMVRERTRDLLTHYVEVAHRLGLATEYGMDVGTEVVAEAEVLCARIAGRFPRAVFFLGKLVFEHETWVHRILHNETAYQLQRRLQFAGLNAMVLPVRVLKTTRA